MAILLAPSFSLLAACKFSPLPGNVQLQPKRVLRRALLDVDARKSTVQEKGKLLPRFIPESLLNTIDCGLS